MQSTDSSLQQNLQILKRQWWLVLLVPAIMIVAMLAVLGTRGAEYKASTTLVVGEPRGSLPPVLGSHSVTRTMTTLLRSDLVARTVIRKLKLDMPNEALLKKLKVDVLPDTSVLNVTYSSSDRRQAFAVVAEIGRIFTRELDETLGVKSGASGSRKGSPPSFDLIVRVFDQPHVEKKEIARASYVVFAGLAGLALGFLVAIGREALTSPIQRRRDAEEWFGAPVVGTLPKALGRRPLPGLGGRRDILGRDDERVASLDLLRARLEFAQIGVAGPTILVTSAGSEVDTSPVAASLSAALTWAGNRVVCVDADLRRPSLNQSLGLAAGGPGLVDVLERGLPLVKALIAVDLVQPAANGRGPSDARKRPASFTAEPAKLLDRWRDSVRSLNPLEDDHVPVSSGAREPRQERWVPSRQQFEPKRQQKAGRARKPEDIEPEPPSSHGKLELLPAGGPPTSLVGVLTPSAVSSLLEQVHQRADYVVFDCPSLLVADALPLALQSDNVLVVARRGRTTRQQAESVRETLEGLGVTRVGIVLTDTSPSDGYG